jgi:6-phosphofructokinase
MAAPTGKMKLAVLTSGGDSAGMNAVVRAIVKIGILRCVLKILRLVPRFSRRTQFP